MYAFPPLGYLATEPLSAQAILAAGSVMQECEDYDVALVKYRVPAGM